MLRHGGATVWGAYQFSIVGHPAVMVTLSCHCCCTGLYKDGTTSVRIMKLTDLISQATLAAAAAVVLPTSLVVPRLGTTYDAGGGTTSPAQAKIIIGGPCTRRGQGGNTSSINTDACFDTCVSQGSSQTVSSWPVLRRVIRRGDTGSHTQQPLITVGDITIVEHCVK